MLNALKIVLLMDSRTVDASGDAITLDRSRHGIHAQLGDGTTAATMPTLDALNGRFTFGGDDYMVLRAADDVDDVLAGMAEIKSEFYMFYLDPGIFSSGPAQTLFDKQGPGLERIFIRYNNADEFQMNLEDPTGVGSEDFRVPAATVADWNDKRVLLTFYRELDVQECWANDVLIASGTDGSKDGSNGNNAYIGARFNLADMLLNDTGIKFFAYGQYRPTQTWLRQLSRFLRGNL